MKHGVGVLPWSPLAGGFLSAKTDRGAPPPPGTRLEQWKQRFAGLDTDRNWHTVEVLKAVAHELGVTPAQVALAWCIHKPAITSVIFGARSPEQLDDNLKAATLELSPAIVQRLDEASAFPLGYPYEFMRNIQGRW